MKSTVPVDSIFFDQVYLSISLNPLVHDIKNNSSKSHDTSKFEFKDSFLYFKGRLYVLEAKARLCALQAHHDFLAIRYF